MAPSSNPTAWHIAGLCVWGAPYALLSWLGVLQSALGWPRDRKSLLGGAGGYLPIAGHGVRPYRAEARQEAGEGLGQWACGAGCTGRRGQWQSPGTQDTPLPC